MIVAMQRDSGDLRYTIAGMESRSFKRPSFIWRLRTRELELGPRTLVMGILNVTPDSFSDGGKFLARDHAVAHALKMLDDGADLLDIGGESTRPGTPVIESGIPAAEELRRIMPVMEDVLRERPGAILSVDTYKAEVARAAVNAGCEIVNDVSALRWDEQMAATVAELACGVILMHTRGRPQEWRDLPPSADILAEVKTELRESAQTAVEKGNCPRAHHARRRLRLRQEIRAELSAAGRPGQIAGAWLSAAGGDVAKIFCRPHAGPSTAKTPRLTSACTARLPP